MGNKINTTSAENYPSVSPDEIFLFYDRREKSVNNEPSVDIFWVNAKIIENLKPKQ